MQESEQFENILRRMLDSVSTKVDKREGAVIYDTLAASAAEFQNAYIARDVVQDETFADTASREFLIKRCAERGVTPKLASKAVVQGKFTPANVDVLGKRFSHEDLNYIVTEKIDDGLYYLECETAGSLANGQTGRLIPIDYIGGLETAEIVKVTVFGDDDEDTEVLRTRYFEAMKAEAYGGNKLDYRNKVLSIPGVGGCKIYSGAQWNGGGTVLIVVQASTYGVPDSDFTNTIQEDFDPQHSPGEGAGIAPIGHFVTVVPANETVVNIDTTFTYGSGASWDTVKENVKLAVNEYLTQLNKKWDASEINRDVPNHITVRIAHVESALLDVPGIIDVQNTTLNGKLVNLAVDKDSLVIRGTINGDS